MIFNRIDVRPKQMSRNARCSFNRKDMLGRQAPSLFHQLPDVRRRAATNLRELSLASKNIDGAEQRLVLGRQID